LESCALEPDLEILQGGDLTEIGEKVNYSERDIMTIAVSEVSDLVKK